MSRSPLALLLMPAIAAMAQTDSSPPPAPPSALSAPTASVEHPRAVSSATAALLNAARPKISPLPPAEKKSAEELPDLRETDRPRNDIIRLPKYLVQEPRPPVFRERDFLDEAGRIALGMKRYPGLGMFPLSSLNGATALQMLQEDARLEDMAAFKDLIRTAGVSDPAARDKLKNLWLQTYQRDNSWVTQRKTSWSSSKW